MNTIHRALLLIVIAVSTLLSQPAKNDWEVYGVRQFDRKTGKSQADKGDQYTETFTVPVQGEIPCTLQIINGDERGNDNRTSGATVVLNGKTICTESDFEHDNNRIDREVVVKSKNTCEVTVHGKHQGHIIIHCIYHLKPIHPILECVQKNPDGSHIVKFGYRNDNDFDVPTPIGILNSFSPSPIDRGQPGIFKSGHHSDVFSVVYKEKEITWQLRGEQAVANNDPSLACITEPTLSITSPVDGLLTRDSIVIVTGTASNNATVKINGVTVKVTNGVFQQSIAIQEGANTITAEATANQDNDDHKHKDHDGHDKKENDDHYYTTTIVRHVIRDSISPLVVIGSPVAGLITNQHSLIISGTTTDTHAVTVSVNGASVTFGQNGSWTTQISLNQGANTITIAATDAAGNITSISRTVIADWTAPALIVSALSDSTVTKSSLMTISGTVKDSSIVTLTVNGLSVPVNSGTFTTQLVLKEGTNIITIVATDAAGNITTVAKNVRLDTQAPICVVQSPKDSLITNLSSITIGGMVSDSSMVTLTVNGISLPVNNGQFATQVVLTEGINKFAIAATDAVGNTTSISRMVIVDRLAPDLVVSSPLDSMVTNLSPITVSGTVKDSTTINVTVNGNSVPISNGLFRTMALRLNKNSMLISSGTFTTMVDIAEGLNTLTISATDAAGNSSSIERTVRLDTQSPICNIQTPDDSLVTTAPSITISGTIFDSTTPTLTINGKNVLINNGMFSTTLSLNEGLNSVQLIATDVVGNSTIVSRSIWRDTVAPVIDIAWPQNGMLVYDSVITITGLLNDETHVALFVNGMAAINGSSGTFAVQVPLVKGKNIIAFQATDEAGNRTDSVQSVTFVPLPPDPVKVAPKVNKTTVTTLASAIEFLYTGLNPIQTGVDTSMLKPVRLSVIRGKVLTRDLKPLPGVKVAILDHPEFGETMTRKDGVYDMVVNGGGQLTVTFSKENYLTISRQVNAEWQRYTKVNDAIMNMFDPQITKVAFTDTTATVARGSVITDQDGTRQATLIVKPGTHALMKTIHYTFKPTSIGSGTQLMKVATDTVVQEMDTLSIRATEYTVGASGYKNMPAPLPPSSAYTYAAEFSADEAIAAGATTIEFDKPVPFYLENFLKFPVGTIVPTGYYDKDRSCWVATDNGIIMQIVNTNNGVAAIDLDGDGNPEDNNVLEAIGIDSLEQTRLASLYGSGQNLWRVPMKHFTPVDCNWPGKINGAGTTDTARISNNNQTPIVCPYNASGSIIGVLNQTLGESIHITGSPYALFYNTDRTQGFKQNHFLSLPLTGDTLPDGLTGVEMDVQIAGRDFDTTFSPQPNMTKPFLWDGKDAYGRVLQGMQPVDVHIGYVYKATYLGPIEHVDHPAFGQPGDEPLTDGRGTAIAWRTWSSYLSNGNSNQMSVGGWSVDVHHSYDVNNQTICYGYGSKQSAQAIGAVIYPVDGTDGAGNISMAVGPDGALYFTQSWTNQVWKRNSDGLITLIAGTGDCGYSGDGGLATDALLYTPQGLAIGHDGSVYISDGNNNVIRRVAPDGIISTFAGNGESAYSGDGGLAINAALNYPCDLSFGPDGTFYIADNGNHCIRSVNTAGMISTFAGNGIGGFSGDGGKATSAMLYYPSGVAVDIDGTVYIADMANARVRKVTSDGIITTYAGIGAPDNIYETAGDGGLAVNAQFCNPVSLALGSNGSLYIADWGCVRAISKEGTISSIVGAGNTSNENIYGGLATDVSVNSSGVAVGPDGAIYVAVLPPMAGDNSPVSNKLVASTMLNYYNDAYVALVKPAFPGLDLSSDKYIASEDGKETYIFDSNGKHQRTVDNYTGVNLFTFSYDSIGFLKSITDRNKLKTIFTRDANGNPKTIVSPYGQQTILSLDTTGYLSAVIDPLNDTTRFEYSIDGLMKSMTDAKGNMHNFNYDELGRLIRDQDPTGGYKTLTRMDSQNGYAVKVATALGNASIYTISQDPIGQQTFVNVDAQGLSTSTNIGSDGLITTQLPDGTITQILQSPDPVSGMQSPLMTTIITTPAGISSTTTHQRTISQLEGETIVGLTDIVDVNGRTYTQTYDGIQKMFASYSPEGRQSYSFLDTLGRIIQDSVPGVFSTNYIYDTKGRVTTVKQGDRTSSLIYDSLGRVASSIDPMLHTSRFVYDPLNRMTQQTSPDGKQILYRYDANSNLIGLTPSEKPEHTFDYTVNDLNNLYTPPFAGDSARATRYFYDLDKRLTMTFRPDSGIVSITYDTAGCGCGATTEHIHSVTFDRGTQTYNYDTVGRLQTVITPEGDSLVNWYEGSLLMGVTKSKTDYHGIHYCYDNNFQITDQEVWIADTSGDDYDKLTEYSYDNDQNITEISLYDWTSDGLVPSGSSMTIAYDPNNGKVTGTTLGNVNTSQNYDSSGLLSFYETDFSGSPIFQTSYQRDSLNRISLMTEINQGITTKKKYSYDLVGRLSQVWRNDTLISTYSYDANGNRVMKLSPTSTDSGKYDAQDRMLSYGNACYIYSKNGELRKKVVGTDTTNYVYDYFGNLLNVRLRNGGLVEYIIDGKNRRIGKKVNGTIARKWIYAEGISPIAELDSAGNVVAQFLGTLMMKNGNTYKLISDQLGSVRLVLDVNSGEVAQQIDYDEFGNIINDSNPGFQPFAYAGGLYDSQTNLVRFGARDYDASVGRWTCKDPIGFKGGSSNLDMYVGNDPINNSDPTGLCKTCVGTARFSGVGPNQATGAGALAGYGIRPKNGTVAVNPAIFGLKMGTTKENEKAQRTLAKDIAPNVVILMPVGAGDNGQQLYQSFTISDIGDANIRKSETARFDIYRFSSNDQANEFGNKQYPGTIILVPDNMPCPKGFEEQK